MPKSTPKIDDAQVFALADQGLSQRQIAERLGVSHVAIGNRLRARPVTEGPAQSPMPDVPLRGRLAAVAAMLTEVGGFPEHIETLHEAIARIDAPATIEPDEPEPEPDEPTDHLARCKALYDRSIKLAGSAQRLGNFTAAQRAMRDGAALATLIARIERTTRDDQDVFRISKAEIDEAMAAVNARVRQICERPLLCQDCGRKLSAIWAELDPMPAEETKHATP